MISLKNKVLNSPSFVNFPLKEVCKSEFKVSGLSGSLRSFFISYLEENSEKPVVFISSDSESAERMYEDIQQLAPEQELRFIPKIENNPFDEKQPNPSLLKLKADALQSLLETEDGITIINSVALLEKSTSPEDLVDNQIYLENGKEIDFDELIQLFINCGFERKDIVEDVGQFSIRGGIIDIYTWNYDEPLRLEFFGDQLESIRYFNIISQRSINETDKITILPSLVQNQHSSSILDFLNEDSIFIVEDKIGLHELLKDYFQQIKQVYEKNIEQDIIFEEPLEKYLDFEEIESYLNDKNIIRMDLLSDEKIQTYKFDSSPPPTFAANINR